MKNSRFLLKKIEELSESFSDDIHRQVGCGVMAKDAESMLVGFNTFPEGIGKHQNRKDRKVKSFYIEHAERSVIYSAARAGISLEGSKFYLPWFPCADCARAIISCGAIELICYTPDLEDKTSKWRDSHEAAYAMLTEAGIKITTVSKKDVKEESFKKHFKKNALDIRPYVPGEDLSSIANSDDAKKGDMIARDPKNPKDQWLISKACYEENYIFSDETEENRSKEVMKIIKDLFMDIDPFVK